VKIDVLARFIFWTTRRASPRLLRMLNCVFLYSSGSWLNSAGSLAFRFDRFVVFSSSMRSRARVMYSGTVEYVWIIITATTRTNAEPARRRCLKTAFSRSRRWMDCGPCAGSGIDCAPGISAGTAAGISWASNIAGRAGGVNSPGVRRNTAAMRSP
jgi:hypothetical protein